MARKGEGRKVCKNGHPYALGSYRRAGNRRYCLKCYGPVAAHQPGYSAANRLKLRLQALAACGGACVCCDETWPDFLHIDHVDGGGNEERRELGGGDRLARVLRKLGFPPGYQVLCANCNHAKGMRRACPLGHDQETRDYGKVAA